MRRYLWICRPHGRQARMSAPVAGLCAAIARGPPPRRAASPASPFGRRRPRPAGRLCPFRGRSAVSSGARIGPLYRGAEGSRRSAAGGIFGAVCPRSAAWSSLGLIASDKPYLSMVTTARRPTSL